MRFRTVAGFSSLLLLTQLSVGLAQVANPEDEPILDENTPEAPAVPGNLAPDAPDVPPIADADNNATTTPDATGTTVTATAGSGETVTIPRAVWEQLQRDVAELKRSRGTQTGGGTTGGGAMGSGVTPATGTGAAPNVAPEAEANRTGGGNYLLLPDISLILQAKGLYSSDKRAEDRSRFNLAEGELGIQGYVYPNVKADAFIVGAPSEDAAFQFEEGFLTFQGVRRGLNINVGRKFTPFGRTGELHNHSFLYPRQLLPIQNLVAGEALVGDGVGLNYLVPNTGKYFLRASLGAWSGQGTESQFNSSNPDDPFFGSVAAGPGSAFTRRFYTGRLWAGRALGQDGEVELGVSRAHGTSEIGDDVGNNFGGNVSLTGFDATYRRFMPRGRRLLLRSEYFRNKPSGALPTQTASGYYGLANFRFSPFNDVGLLYENSGFPQSRSEREKAYSLILTRQFTEQFYVRLMGTHGSRPGDKSYNELRLQFTAGLGPHSHSLE